MQWCESDKKLAQAKLGRGTLRSRGERKRSVWLVFIQFLDFASGAIENLANLGDALRIGRSTDSGTQGGLHYVRSGPGDRGSLRTQTVLQTRCGVRQSASG
jgi:hypothetical protein